jgi:hypothetical protein
LARSLSGQSRTRECQSGIDRCDHRSEAGRRMQQRDCEPDAHSDSVDPAQMHSRLGMDGSRAGSAASQRAVTAHLNRHQARTLLRELPPHLRDMANFTLATGLRAANVTGLTWEQVDLSRKLAWIHPDQAKARKASGSKEANTRFRCYLRRSAHQAGQHGSVVQGARARRYRGLSLARSAPHVGELARAGRDTALRVTGARGMGNREGGASLRAPRRGTSGGLRRQHGRSRHNYGTSTGLPRHTPIADRWEIMKLMVARGGIEPPTRGFSVRHILHPVSPKSIQYNHLADFHLTVGDGRRSWVTLGWKPNWKHDSVRSRAKSGRRQITVDSSKPGRDLARSGR